MNILLIDVDSKIPNLALMKLSTYHKARGDVVKLQVIGDYTDNIYTRMIPDKIYVSIIFKRNKHKADGLRHFYPDIKPENIVIGGSGYDINSRLPDEVDCLKPDYDLYPNCDSSYGYTCYDDITEVLTIDGWKLFKDLKENDEVATLNSKEELIYQKPSGIIAEEYSGKMLRFKNMYIDLLVTPNHKMYLRLNNGNFELVEAQLISDIHRLKLESNFRYEFKKNCNWDGVEKEFFELSHIVTGKNHKDYIHKMDDWLEFFGYYIADGNAQYKERTKNYIIRITKDCLANEDVYDSIDKCIQRLGYSCYKNPHGFHISNKQLYEYLNPLGKAWEKYIPKEIKLLSSRQLRIFLNAYNLCDGHTYSETSKVMISTSRKLVDDIQELLLKTGICGDIKLHCKEGEGEAKRDCFEISTQSAYVTPQFINEVEKINYNSKVYCCEIPNHVIYVRRNGVACWCGNSRGCNRQCYFCIVPRKEGKFKKYMHPSVFYDRRFDKIFFLDNNILWDKEWFREVIQFCLNNRLKPWFNQGLDIRLIDESDIKLLMRVKRIEMFEFAWDDIKLEKIVKSKIQMLKSCGLNTRQKVQIYTYVDSDDEFESGLYRCNELKKLNTNAFVMFNIDNPRTQRISDLMRWTNKKLFFWKYSFEEYLKIHHHRSEHRDKGQTDIDSAWDIV